MIIVATGGVGEDELLSGRLACECGGCLAPWGYARRRMVRGVADLVRPRRGRCGSCSATHVLLPASCLARRADGVDVIGQALVMAAQGAGARPIALFLDRPMETVRGWLRAARVNAGRLVGLFTGLVVELDSLAPVILPGVASVIGGVVDALGRLVAAFQRRVAGGRPGLTVAVWRMASMVTGGLLLSGRLWGGGPTRTSPDGDGGDLSGSRAGAHDARHRGRQGKSP